MPTPEPTDALSAALAFLGPWGALAGLALKFGTPFVTKLIQNAHDKVDPTPENWKSTTDLIEIPGEVLVPQRPLGVANP